MAGAVTEVVLADRILRDGEQIILTVKPSACYVVLSSWPVLLVTAVVAGAFALTNTWNSATPSLQVVLPACAAIAGLGLMVAAVRWLGRLYVLTNRRILRLRGVVRVDVFECELSRISGVAVVRGRAERMVGLGSLEFAVDGNPYAEPDWINIHQPDAVAEEVRKAIARCRREGGVNDK
jgi:membrane protein YdbS with pleckstrin-like domain